MVKSIGVHLKKHEVKAGILDFILKSNGSVREPDIRDHLKKDYDIVDHGNIKTHLRELQNRFHCIEKFPPNKQESANRWEIRRIEHVRNIRLHFPEIQIKTYDKSLKSILKRFYPSNSDSFMANKLRVQLFLSNPFFDMCIKTYPETVDTIAYELYKHSFDKWGKEYPEWEQRVLDDMCQGEAVHLFTKIMKEIPFEYNIPTDAEGLKTAFETKAMKIKDEVSDLMSYWYQMDKSGEIFEMKLPLYISPVLNEIMFELCFQIDIKDGTVSPEEIEFVNKTKEMRAHYKANPEISLFSQLKGYDDFYVQYFEKFKAKTETPQTSTSCKFM